MGCDEKKLRVRNGMWWKKSWEQGMGGDQKKLRVRNGMWSKEIESKEWDVIRRNSE